VGTFPYLEIIMEFIYLVLFNTIPAGQKHQQALYVKTFDMLNEAEDMCITLNSMHQANPSYGHPIGEFDFYYVKTYLRCVIPGAGHPRNT
jgi:hypothetical protein